MQWCRCVCTEHCEHNPFNLFAYKLNAVYVHFSDGKRTNRVTGSSLNAINFLLFSTKLSPVECEIAFKLVDVTVDVELLSIIATALH